MDNKPYFHNKETFLIRNRQKIEQNFFYWITSTKSGKSLKLDSRQKKFLLF